jgi:hypothetical protein
MVDIVAQQFLEACEVGRGVSQRNREKENDEASREFRKVSWSFDVARGLECAEFLQLSQASYAPCS